MFHVELLGERRSKSYRFCDPNRDGALPSHPAVLPPDRTRCSGSSISVLTMAAVTGDSVLGGAMAGNLYSVRYAAGWAQYWGRRAGIAFV